MGLIKMLRRPFYTELATLYWVKMALIFGSFVFLFLFLFRPFQIENVDGNFFLVCLAFGGITAGAMLLMDTLLLPVLADKIGTENWTVGWSVLWTLVHIFVIGVLNSIYYSYTFLDDFYWTNLIWFLFVTLLVSLFPVSIIFILQERKENRKIRDASDQITETLKEQIHQEEAVREVLIRSKNANEDLVLLTDDLFYMQATDNYVTVFFVSGGDVTKHIVRNTITGISEDLAAAPQLFFCHRSYIVNLDQVVSVSGNAQGFRLSLKGINETIPVSRKHNDFIKSYFDNHPKS